MKKMWNKFVASITSSDHENVVASQYRAYLKEMANKYIQLDWVKSIKSRETWSNLNTGKILFSDSWKTINFENGALKTHNNTLSKDQCIANIKGVLKNFY